MIQQVEFSLRPLPRGFHLVTNEVMRNLPALPKTDRKSTRLNSSH